ncbi:MAG: DinB family protein [Spirochaetaceae bacterium]|jgi:uncharacterized damage-inducible protein DinB|nr:DinB family protein [Spirochaetaceae bacterium]
MQKDTFTLFVKYNRTANEGMNTVIKTLSPEEWDKDLGGYFKSIRGLCSHLYVCDFNWLKRFSKFRDFAVFNDPFFLRDMYSYREVLFPDIGEYLSKRPVLDEKMIAFVDEISGKDLQSSIQYTGSGGTPYERNFGGALMQCLNHETHQRGMISFCLEMLGRDNDFSSFGQVYK